MEQHPIYRVTSVEPLGGYRLPVGFDDQSSKWENNSNDLRLYLEHASHPISELLCTWVDSLHIDLEGEGPLLTWEATIEATQDGRWSVFLDFSGEGEIRFECDEITAEVLLDLP